MNRIGNPARGTARPPACGTPSHPRHSRPSRPRHNLPSRPRHSPPVLGTTRPPGTNVAAAAGSSRRHAMPFAAPAGRSVRSLTQWFARQGHLLALPCGSTGRPGLGRRPNTGAVPRSPFWTFHSPKAFLPRPPELVWRVGGGDRRSPAHEYLAKYSRRTPNTSGHLLVISGYSEPRKG